MVNGKWSLAEVAHRCEEIDDAIETSNSEYEKVRIKKKLKIFERLFANIN